MAGRDQQTTGKIQGRPENLTNAGKGRPKGVPNKSTTLLKDAILQAAQNAGGKTGLIGYLQKQANDNPQSFLPLLGKVLPLTINGSGPNGEQVVRVEIVGVTP